MAKAFKTAGYLAKYNKDSEFCVKRFGHTVVRCLVMDAEKIGLKKDNSTEENNFVKSYIKETEENVFASNVITETISSNTLSYTVAGYDNEFVEMRKHILKPDKPLTVTKEETDNLFNDTNVSTSVIQKPEDNEDF
jgi:hypothetical protein